MRGPFQKISDTHVEECEGRECSITLPTHTRTREPTLTLSYRADGSVRLNAAAQRRRDKVSCHNDRLLFPGAAMTERSRHCCVFTSYWICAGQPKKYSILSFCFFQTNQSESQGNASDKRWGGAWRGEKCIPTLCSSTSWLQRRPLFTHHL